MDEVAIRQDFTVSEWSERSRCIMTLRNYAGASVAAAKALAMIRDKKLYRPHKTLKEFCQHECGFSERRLFQILSFADVKSSLPVKTEPLVQSERQARELAKVPVENRVAVLTEAQRNGKITAETIREAAIIVVETREVDKAGNPIPVPASAYWKRIPEAKQVLAQISAARGQVKKLNPDDPMWSGINLNGVIADLNSAYNRFAASVPAYVCPVCKGEKPKGCKCCKSKGVLSEYFYRMVPEELKK